MIRRIRPSVHSSEDELVLYFYGEHDRPGRVEAHLDACPVCRSQYDVLRDTLALVEAPAVPERGEIYGLEVWQRIRPQLPASDVPRRLWRPWTFVTRHPVIASLVVVLLMSGAFAAGRYTPAAPAASVATATGQPSFDPAQARVAATLDHLEQSERVLLELVNASSADLDLRVEQEWASDLVDANRLYRDAAAQAGDESTATLLEDLERSLLDIVHAPATLSPAQLQSVLARLDAAALIFRVRIITSELRDRELARPSLRKTT